MADFDLHTKLRSAIELYLMLAENATPGPWEYATHEGRTYIGRADTLPSVAEVEFDTDVHFMLAFAPDWAIRACRADLDRLQRHQAHYFEIDGAEYVGEKWCEACDGAPPQPCPEVRSLAEVWLPDDKIHEADTT